MEMIIRRAAASMIFLSIALAYFVSINWLILALFVAVNLMQSSFTKWCPLEKALIRLNRNTYYDNYKQKK